MSKNKLLNIDYSRFSYALTLAVMIWLVSLSQIVGLLPDIIPKLYPRSIDGLWGILTMPFLHGGMLHLLSNTIPLLVLSCVISLKGNKYFSTVTVAIVLLSGLMLWCVGRSAYHVGASGLIFGYFGFLCARLFYSPKISDFVISILVMFFYGGMVFGVIPTDGRISWEGHLCGLVAGVLVARLMKYKV